AATLEGKKHALNYPVEKTGILLPYHSIKRFLNGDLKNPLKVFITQLVGGLSPFSSFDEMEEWLGLIPYPSVSIPDAYGPYLIPGPQNPHRMGLTLTQADNGARAFTISCAQCHTSHLFGTPIFGMSNRFPRANDFFQKGLKAL